MEIVPNVEGMPTPNEELAYLHGQFNEAIKQTPDVNRENLSHSVIQNYVNTGPKELFGAGHNFQETVIAGIALKLKPEPHDGRMEELYRILESKGVYSALKVVEKIADAHLEDDFHRFLAEFVREGHGVKGMKEKTDLSKSVRRTLFQIQIPKIDSSENLRSQNPKDLLQKMEGIYSALQSEEKEKETVVLEIANSAGTEELVFYASVPIAWANRFENLVKTSYPEAQVYEATNDFNIFATKGEISISTAELSLSSALPILTYEAIDHDPMNIILGSFGKLNKEREGALLQIIYGSASKYFEKEVYDKKSAIEKGENPAEVLKNQGAVASVFKTIISAFKSSNKPAVTAQKESAAGQKYAVVLDKLNKKLARPIVPVWLRIATSAENHDRAEAIRLDIEASFKQFSEPQGNNFVFKKVKDHDYKRAIRAVSFRLSSFGMPIYLNTAELATVFHFESSGLTVSPTLKVARAVSKPAPLNLSTDGTLLGINNYQNTETKVYISDEDRLRHFYTIGQTGTGKSTLLKNMIIQDIQKGNGVCMIDPHGSDILDVLAHIPSERRADVIYFDPSYTERPMGLNMLEYDINRPEQKTFVVNELFNIFQKLYGGVPESMGPMFEQYFRNATMLVIEDPETGCTLLDVSRVMSNKEYRKLKLSRCKNPIVSQFWTEIAEKAGGEASLANIVPYITSKFDIFLANDIMRPIIVQEKSAFDFREIMDNKKILLVNLAKGRLGDINANLIGLILVGKILMAALSRVDNASASLPPFYLYIDEFQNITTSSISTILSEARKYKLSLSIAHQFIGQLSADIKNAVFGNVGNIVVYRVGADDAEYLAKQLEPTYKASDIMNIDNYNAYIKMLVHGKPTEPFNIQAMTPPPATGVDVIAIQELSYQRYGRNREEVQAEVMKKYEKTVVPESNL